jgi:transcriptional regulator with XRE-family HTH domain
MFRKDSIVRETMLAELRLDNDLKQKDVALKLDIEENNYSKWERNVTDIPLDKFNELANLYDCSLDYLIGLTNSKTKSERKTINLNLLSQRLLEMRKGKNLTQEKLSNEIGYPQTTYSNYENGSRIPTIFKLMYIAIYYNISLDYLVGRTDIKKVK